METSIPKSVKKIMDLYARGHDYNTLMNACKLLEPSLFEEDMRRFMCHFAASQLIVDVEVYHGESEDDRCYALTLLDENDTISNLTTGYFPGIPIFYNVTYIPDEVRNIRISDRVTDSGE